MLLWSLVHDAKRLTLHELALAPLSELARLGQAHAQNTQNTARQAQVLVSQVMCGLYERILASGLDNALTVSDASRVEQAFGKLHREALIPKLENVVQAAQPMRDWVDTITRELADPLQAPRELVLAKVVRVAAQKTAALGALKDPTIGRG